MSHQSGPKSPLSTPKTAKLLKDLATPAMVINRHAFQKNCRSMIEMAQERGLHLRPHVKTHKTPEGAWIQGTGHLSSEGGKVSDIVTGFVASTLPEVSMLIDAAPQYGKPFRDVLYGVPISESKLHALDTLRRKNPDCQIHIMVDHPAQVVFVQDFVKKNSDAKPFSAFLKLDTGYHRAGIPCDERGVDLAMQILDSPYLELKGVYSHCGHSYDVNGVSKQEEIARLDLSLIESFLDSLKNRLETSERSASVDDLVVSVGSTPSAKHHFPDSTLKNALEIHPGNYTLYDRQQLWTGACAERSHVAGRVLSRVIGHYDDRIMLDAGATALTKDSTPQGGVCEIGGNDELE